MLERSDVLKMGAFFEMDTGLRRYDVNTPLACCGVVYLDFLKTVKDFLSANERK